MLSDSFVTTVELLSQLELIHSNLAAALSAKSVPYSQSFVVISTLHSIFIRSTFHLKNPLFFLLVHKKLKFYPGITAIQPHLQAPLLILVLPLFPPQLVLSCTEVLSLQFVKNTVLRSTITKGMPVLN